jgi:hypothetical protein
MPELAHGQTPDLVTSVHGAKQTSLVEDLVVTGIIWPVGVFA